MPIQVGSYSVLNGETAQSFWPLAPGTSIEAATASVDDAFVAPGSTNTLTAPLTDFGIFDIVLELSPDAVVQTEVEAPAPALAERRVQVGSAVTTMPLLLEGDGGARRCHLCFAAQVSAGQVAFTGMLRLEARYTTGAATQTCRLDVALRVERQQCVTNLFIYYVVHRKPSQRYCWVKLRVVEAGDGTTPVEGASVSAEVLRDNLGSGYRDSHRRVRLQTGADGYVADGTRPIMALPIDWPLLFRATLPACVQRGHLVRLGSEQLTGNTNQHPFEAPVLPMTQVVNASLATHRFLLDPGHGVVYALATSRRSQEWYGVHRIADRVAELLQSRHGVPADSISWTRSAGFGLIEPVSVHAANAPEAGDGFYQYDMAQQRIRVRNAQRSLQQLSDLLLVRHQGDDDTAQAVLAADRARLLATNEATVMNIVARLNQQLLPQQRRVRAGSVRWDEPVGGYVYTQEALQPPHVIVNAAVALPITAQDWFGVDAGMLEVLAERSARWSLRCEVGGSAAFQAVARAAMRETGFVDYARAKTLQYLHVTAPHSYLQSGIKAWGPTPRTNYLNGVAPTCDLYLTLHLNAGPGKGAMSLLSRVPPNPALPNAASAPPVEQLRLAKTFVKYVDPFDQGTRQGGVTLEEAGNPAAMLSAQNQHRARYVYFELEFMDAPHPTPPAQYRYEDMVRQPFIDTVAEQIVAGIVEALLNPQADFDSVTYTAQLPQNPGNPKLW
ncbi:hypothetical protein [Myxococcus sp. SDU36]|uniref:hypothetical protein n=1 Tax=Myxococcus sp. SDU36 TaxID=2831967 RepID=UPI0025439157|nr:hypothetical protein [Myxococcus sp. SDU36]WIG94821.1 hypothetical protein KGD87_30620 [Myxococcus sp. SDU36]